jgi:hypothetical protein
LIVGGGTRENGERLYYGVKLDLAPFDVADISGAAPIASMLTIKVPEEKCDACTSVAMLTARESAIHGAVELCEAGASGARLIAVASLFGITQVRVCQKNTTEGTFKEQFGVAYSYGPGGSEGDGRDVSISFTCAAELAQRIEYDARFDKELKRKPEQQRAKRIRTIQTRFLWAQVHGKQRHYTFIGAA